MPPEAVLKSPCVRGVGGMRTGREEETTHIQLRFGGLSDSHGECCAWEQVES